MTLVTKVLGVLLMVLVGVWPASAGTGRVEIHQRHMHDAPFHITEPGSYILTSPLIVTQLDTSAIWVSANHVSIDLNGFAITGPGNSANASAILQASPVWHHLTVRNGTIRSWGGLNAAYGIAAFGSDNQFIDLTIHDCRRGILTGDRATISGCIVYDSSLALGDSDGFQAGFESTVSMSSAIRIGAFFAVRGFSLLPGSRLTDVIAFRVSGGQATDGINAGASAMIRGSVARRISSGNNAAAGVRASDDSVIRYVATTDVQAFEVGQSALGISLQNRGQIFHSLVQDAGTGVRLLHDGTLSSSAMLSNRVEGAYFFDRNRVVDSLARGNTQYGFLLAGQRNDIADNAAVGNGTGFFTFTSHTNFLARNTAIANVNVDYAVVATTRFGQQVANPGANFAVTNSWANFSITP